MTREEIKKALEENLGKEVWVTFVEEVPTLLRIDNLDSEGFSNHVEGKAFWPTDGDVVHVKVL